MVQNLKILENSTLFFLEAFCLSLFKKTHHNEGSAKKIKKKERKQARYKKTIGQKRDPMTSKLLVREFEVVDEFLMFA